jgi:hypothetical protein
MYPTCDILPPTDSRLNAGAGRAEGRRHRPPVTVDAIATAYFSVVPAPHHAGGSIFTRRGIRKAPHHADVYAGGTLAGPEAAVHPARTLALRRLRAGDHRGHGSTRPPPTASPDAPSAGPD